MSGWPSHISNQMDALKMILFITSIFVFPLLSACLTELDLWSTGYVLGQISWQRLFLAFRDGDSLASLHTLSQCRVVLMVWSFFILIGFLWTVAATEGYGLSRTGYITLALTEWNLVAYSFLLIHLIMLACLAAVVCFQCLIHCNPWLLFCRPRV